MGAACAAAGWCKGGQAGDLGPAGLLRPGPLLLSACRARPAGGCEACWLTAAEGLTLPACPSSSTHRRASTRLRRPHRLASVLTPRNYPLPPAAEPPEGGALAGQRSVPQGTRAVCGHLWAPRRRAEGVRAAAQRRQSGCCGRHFWQQNRPSFGRVASVYSQHCSLQRACGCILYSINCLYRYFITK